MTEIFRIAMLASLGAIGLAVYLGIAWNAAEALIDEYRQRRWGGVIGLSLFIAFYLSLGGFVMSNIAERL